MQTKHRILTVLLALCVAFTMMPLAGIAGLAAYAADGKGAEGEYLNVPAKFDQEIDISKVSGDIVIKDSKTYRIYSSEKKTVNHKIKIQKPTLKNIEPHVFIDGISIAMDAGSKCPAIEINNKASAYLYFYGGKSDLRGADYRAAIQKNRSENNLHILVAGGTGLYCYGGLYAAGIGGSADRNTNWYNIDMYGHGVRLYFGSSEKNTKWNGEIRATGGKNGAGIGGGRYGTGEYIHFMSGKITAKGGDHGAGIGGGRRGSGNYISVYGGEIDAQGGDFAAGIGSGFTQSAKSIRIYGGTVNAKAGMGGAGIGSGAVNTEDEAKNLSVSDIEIAGGTVTAKGVTSGAGIGGGQFVRADNIKITGGTVNARSTYGGAGIGGGSDAIGHNITISGGDVYAKSYGGAGIGGGIEAMGDKIYLSGGHIKAECGKNLGNSPVAFGSGANIRDTNGMFDGGEKVPEEDVYIVLSHQNQVDMKITAECLSFDGIRGYQTFTDSITNVQYGSPQDTQIDFSKLSLPNAQGYGKITIAAELTFKAKTKPHSCAPADHTKNMGKYHMEVCQTCGVRMFYNLTAKSSRHDDLAWNTQRHQKYCEKCGAVIEQDTQAPIIAALENNGAYWISNLPDGSLGSKTFYVADAAALSGEVASGVKSVKLDGAEILNANGTYQIPADGSMQRIHTVTVEDYAGNVREVGNILVYQKHRVTIVDSERKLIYSSEFSDKSTPSIQIGLPAGSAATLTNVKYSNEIYTWENGFFHITNPIRENCTFRLDQSTQCPKVTITQSGQNERSWTSYEADSSETVYLPKDDSRQFTVSATGTTDAAKYFVSPQALTEAELKTKDANSEITWQEADTNRAISIDDWNTFYIYAKAANAKGTAYISSARIVIDSTAPIAKVGTENLSDGAYYWNGLQFSVDDESPVTVTDNGVILTPENGVYTITADEPGEKNGQTYDDPTHTILLKDSCGHTREYSNIKVLVNYLESKTSMINMQYFDNGTPIFALPFSEKMAIYTTQSHREPIVESTAHGPTTHEYILAPVTWFKNDVGYDPGYKKTQNIVVYGKIDIEKAEPAIIVRAGEEEKLSTYVRFTIKAAQTYDITMAAMQHGSVSLVDRPMIDSGLKAYAGETIAFRPVGEAGYTIGNVKVTSQSGQEVPVTVEDGVYSYEQPNGGSTITAGFIPISAYEMIQPEAAEGFENGTSLNAIMQALPETIGVKLNGDENRVVQVPVTWDKTTAKYSPSSRKAQSFTVKGTVDLRSISPDTPKESISIRVTVEEGSESGGSSSGGGAVTPAPTPTDPDAEVITVKEDTKDDTASKPGAEAGTNTTTKTTVKNTTTETTKNEQGQDVSKSTASVSKELGDKLLDQAVSNNSDTIEITVKSNDKNDNNGGNAGVADSVKSTEVKLPKATVDAIAKNTNADLVIKTDNSEVRLDNKTLETIADAAKGDTVTIVVDENTQLKETQKPAADIVGKNGSLFDFIAKIGERLLHQFEGGKVHVTLPMPEKLKDKDVLVIYIDDNGLCKILNHSVEKVGADDYIKFTTTHFSTFAVVDKDEAEQLIKEQNASHVKKLMQNAKFKVTTTKTSKKSVKVQVTAKNNKTLISDIKSMGYTVKYQFYRSTKKSAGYKLLKTKATSTFTNTKGTKGTKYYYKARVLVYDGKTLVAKSGLKACSWGSRVWNK